MTQLQEEENRTSPAATTWAAEFLLRQGESRDILGQWINSSAVHENKRRRATQVITCSFPCRKWLHKLYSRISPFCELCRKEREASGQPADNLPLETSRVRVAKRRNEASSKRTIAAGNSSFKPSWNTEKLRESSSPSDWNQKKGRMNRTPTSYSARDVQTQ